MRILLLIISMISLLTLSCTQEITVKTSTIIDSVLCDNSTEQYYAIYFPKNYNEEPRLPVVYFFDPSARGKLPLEKYCSLAEKYNVIMACTYNSKNGPTDNNFAAASAMTKDIQTKYKIDTTQILLAGFSGGSRFAYSYAQSNSEIDGLIGCGAFFPGGKNNSRPHFKYTGITGISDFNFREGLLMHQSMMQMQLPFQFIIFKGDHDWPSDSIFERGLAYQLAATAPTIENINRSIELEKQSLKQTKDTNDLFDATFALQNLASLNKSYNDSLSNFINSKEFKKQLKEFEKSLQTEDSLIKEVGKATKGIILKTYNQNDDYKNFNWWENEIKKFTNMEKNAKNLYLRNTGKRMKAYICISLWEANRHLIKEKHYSEALETAKILILAKENSPTYQALEAESLFMLDKPDEAIKALKAAYEKGFTLEDQYLKGNKTIIKISKLM